MVRPSALPQGVRIAPVSVLDRPSGQVPGIELLIPGNRYRIGKDTHMKSALNTMCFVALVLAVLGLGMIGAGFVWSGFDTDVFSTGIDHEHGVIVLGGDEVDPDVDLPLLSHLAEWGTFWVGSIDDAAATGGVLSQSH